MVAVTLSTGKTYLRVRSYIFLNTRELDDALVYGAFSDEAIYGDLASLSKTMSAVHGLRIIRWIPIMIIKDDSICGSKVDTQTTSSGAQQEHKDLRSTMMYKG